MELLQFAEVVADTLPFEGGEEELFDLRITLGWCGNDGQWFGLGFSGEKDVRQGFEGVHRSPPDDDPIRIAGQVPQE